MRQRGYATCSCYHSRTPSSSSRIYFLKTRDIVLREQEKREKIDMRAKTGDVRAKDTPSPSLPFVPFDQPLTYLVRYSFSPIPGEVFVMGGQSRRGWRDVGCSYAHACVCARSSLPRARDGRLGAKRQWDFRLSFRLYFSLYIYSRYIFLLLRAIN